MVKLIKKIGQEVMCLVCGYEWTTRKSPKDVKCCPNCKSRNWNK